MHLRVEYIFKVACVRVAGKNSLRLHEEKAFSNPRLGGNGLYCAALWRQLQTVLEVQKVLPPVLSVGTAPNRVLNSLSVRLQQQ